MQVDKLSKELDKQHRHTWMALKSPQDGVIKNLATHPAGTVSSPACACQLGAQGRAYQGRGVDFQ